MGQVYTADDPSPLKPILDLIVEALAREGYNDFAAGDYHHLAQSGYTLHVEKDGQMFDLQIRGPYTDEDEAAIAKSFGVR